MRLVFLHIVCFGLLLSSQPASALNYSGTAYLDLTTLTFSGIGVTTLPGLTPDYASAFGQSQVAVADASTVIRSDGTIDLGGRDDACSGFCASSVWQNETDTAKLQFGTATSQASTDVLSSASNLYTDDRQNEAAASAYRAGFLTAHEAGWLTMSVDYQLTQTGVPNSISGFSSFVRASIGLGGLSAAEEPLTNPEVRNA